MLLSSQCIALQCTVCDQDFKPNCTFKSHMKKHHHRASLSSEAFSQCNPIHNAMTYTMQCHTQCNTLHTGILYIWDILWFQSNHSCTPFLALNNALCVIKILSRAILLRVTWKNKNCEVQPVCDQHFMPIYTIRHMNSQHHILFIGVQEVALPCTTC